DQCAAGAPLCGGRTPLMAVSAVIFDYGGVVRREDVADFDTFRAAYCLAAGGFWAALHDIPAYRFSRPRRLAGPGHRAAVVSALAQRLGVQRAEGMLAVWERQQAAIAPIEPEMRGLLPRLRARARVGLLTNNGAGALARLRAGGVVDFFDDVVCSAD